MQNLIERLFVARTFSRKPYYKYFDSWDTYKRRLPAKYVQIQGEPNKTDDLLINAL